jgi:HK97 gp10 family phage protein
MIKLKVTGFRELERALAEELPKATAKATLRRTAVEAMKPIEDGEKARAPRDKGKIITEIRTQAVKAQRIPGTKRYARSSGVSVNTGPSGRQEGGNPSWQENGTVDMPANPFVRPTVDAEAMNVIGSIRDKLASQIDKAKARIAKRAAKGK